jgi:hypothetical protein
LHASVTFKEFFGSGMKNIVGKRVQEARQIFRPPVSQEALAGRLELDGWKINRGTLSKMEAGIRQVTDFEVMAVAKTLKVPPGWLLETGVFGEALAMGGYGTLQAPEFDEQDRLADAPVEKKNTN